MTEQQRKQFNEMLIALLGIATADSVERIYEEAQDYESGLEQAYNDLIARAKEAVRNIDPILP